MQGVTINLLQDEKKEDEDMEEDSPAKAGDISPIDGPGLDTIAEELKQPSAKRREPASESLPNLSRVTPGQLRYISFPSNSRYQPVRSVFSKLASPGRGKFSRSSVVPEKYSGGGGILLLADLQPDEPAEFIETVQEAVVAEPPSNTDNTTSQEAPSGPHISLDENSPEADPPESFEVCDPFDFSTSLTHS